MIRKTLFLLALAAVAVGAVAPIATIMSGDHVQPVVPEGQELASATATIVGDCIRVDFVTQSEPPTPPPPAPQGEFHQIIKDLQPGECVALPNTAYDGGAFGYPWVDDGGGNPQNKVLAWNSALFAWLPQQSGPDRPAYVFTGGGDGDYGKNWVGVVYLDTLERGVLFSANPNWQNTGGGEEFADGSPVPRHTHDTLEWFDGDGDGLRDSMSYSGYSIWPGAGGPSGRMFRFSFDALVWDSNPSLSPTTRRGGEDCQFGVDALGQLWSCSRYQIARWDILTRSWVDVQGSDAVDVPWGRTVEIDRGKNILLAVGNGEIRTWNLNHTNNGSGTVEVLLGDVGVEWGDNVGLAYHPASGDVVAYEAGQQLTRINTTTWVLTNVSLTGSNPDGHGPFGYSFGHFRHIGDDLFLFGHAGNGRSLHVARLP